MEKQRKKKWLWILGACILIAVLVLLLTRCSGTDFGVPTLIVETPQKLSATGTDEFTLDVTVSNLGEARYPAMSISISFDSSRLEFLGAPRRGPGVQSHRCQARLRPGELPSRYGGGGSLLNHGL